MSADIDDRGDTSIWCHDGICGACEDPDCEHDCHDDEEDYDGATRLAGRAILSAVVVALGVLAVGLTLRYAPWPDWPPLTLLSAKVLFVLAAEVVTFRAVRAVLYAPGGSEPR